MRALPTKYDVVAVRINAPMTISVVLSGVSGLVVFCVRAASMPVPAAFADSMPFASLSMWTSSGVDRPLGRS